MEQRELLPAIVTCLALLVYVWNFMGAGKARGKHKIMAPATTGHPEFERKLRIQQNMLEQLVVFIPSLWIFSLTLNMRGYGTLIAAALGLLFVVGRILYSIGYVADPAKRGPGFGLAALPTLILLVGALAGSIKLYIMNM